jgi:crossover junction endodeoxyribonuclease RusA
MTSTSPRLLLAPPSGPLPGQQVLAFAAYGKPATQGSKRHLGNGISIEANKRLPAWRTDVREACRQAAAALHWDATTPQAIQVVYLFNRPAGHYRTGRYAGLLHPWAEPLLPTSHQLGDLDKLTRAALDACTPHAWQDDALVVEAHLRRAWAPLGHPPGMVLHSWHLLPPVPPANPPAATLAAW